MRRETREVLADIVRKAGAGLVLWSVTHRPDQAGPYQALRWEVNGPDEPRVTFKVIAPTLEEVRGAIEERDASLVRLPPHPLDDPSIIESWTTPARGPS